MHTPAFAEDPEKSRPGARALTARLERINVWAMSYAFIGIIGAGFVLTFFDIFDINVSFVQTCVQIQPGCTPDSAFRSLTTPVLLNLSGYVIGTLVLSPLSDRVGRRNMLLVTMVITGLGSLYNAVVLDMASFDAARVVTGIGVGADLAVVNTYIGEIAPRRGRARFTAVIFSFSAVGAFLGIWLGLLLTTPAARWPFGLPFAMATDTFDMGWRLLYMTGAALAIVGILLRFELPESPRWLISQARFAEAEEVICAMEYRARLRGPLVQPESMAPQRPRPKPSHRAEPGTTLYLRRGVVLLTVWLTGYMTIYAFCNGFVSVLTELRYPIPEAGMITAVGTLGFIVQGVVAIAYVERLERRFWLPIGAVATVLGAVLVAEAGHRVYLGFLGAMVVFFGFNIWVSATYALSAESFPTRNRTTGFALVDGIGHLGGGIGILVVARYVAHLSVLGALLFMASFQIAAAVVVQFAPDTRGRKLDEISP